VVFEALMEDRHVGRAARRLNMSQSGASYALARLRQLVDDPLFLPHPKGVHPSAKALAMAGAVAQILALARATLRREARFDPRQAQRSFAVGATDYVSFVVLPPLIECLRREAPGIDLGVCTIDRDSLITGLDAGDLDFAIGLAADPPDRIAVTPLFQERLVCVARRGHPLFTGAMTPEAFAATPQLLISPRGDAIGPADTPLQALGLGRRIVVTTPHFLAAPFLIGSSDLVALLAERVAQRLAEPAMLNIRPLPFDVPSWTLSLLQRRERVGEAAFDWISTLMAEIGQSLR